MGQVAVDALHSTLFKRAGEVLPAGIELLGQLYRGEGRVLIVSLQVGHGTLHQNVGAAGGRGLAAAGGQRDEQHHLRHLGFKNDVTHLGWQFLALGHPHKKALKIPLVADIRVQHGDAVHPGGVFQVCVAAAGLPEGVVDLDDQTVRVVVINIEDAGVVDLSREVDELADMHQINTAVDGVTHGAAADGQHQLMVGVGMDHGLVVFLVGIPCHQQSCVAQPHPCFRGLTWLDSGARSFYTKATAIRTPADLKGLKIRTMDSQMAIDMMNCLGGSATVMGYSDIYTGMQQGVIDGAENNVTALRDHGDVTKYYCFDEHTRIPDMVIISSNIWNQFSDDQKSAVTECAKAATEEYKTAWKNFEDEVLDKAVNQNGVELVKDVDIAAFQSAVQPIYENLKTANPTTYAVVEEIRAMV